MLAEALVDPGDAGLGDVVRAVVVAIPRHRRPRIIMGAWACG